MEDIIKFYKNNIENVNWVEKFEDAIAKKFNVKYAVACSSGTSALHSALLATGLKKGDEIIVPNLTVVMTIMPIIYIGAVPVFVDCQKDNIDFDYDDLESKITEKTKAIIPVYMWGVPYNIKKLKSIAKKYNLKIIEDACQAQGSRYGEKYLGTIGNVGCFSLKDGKIICAGEGGYCLTNNKKIYTKLLNLRNHYIARNPKNSFREIGYNYRLTNMQAYLAMESLKVFDKNIENRQNICEIFEEKLKNLSSKIIDPKNSNHFSPLVLLNNCDRNFLKELSQNGILNSVGSFGLESASKRKSIKDYLSSLGKTTDIKTKNCDSLLCKLLAIAIDNNYTIVKAKKDAEKVKYLKEQKYEKPNF